MFTKLPAMGKILCILLALSLFLDTGLKAQDKSPDPDIKYDRGGFGFGLGFDYGGIIGVNFTGYPQKNIGIFAGGGYAVAGVGYSVGIKLRMVSNRRFTPYFTAMYGYNAAVAVTNYPNYDKIFYGPSIGLGFDIGSHSAKKGNFSFAILVPIRSPDVQNYINDLHNMYGVQFNNNLWPIGISIGYRFIIF
jgi:hypothetical protein